MRLRYPLVSAKHDTLLLESHSGWRVEMYVLQNNDDSYSLVALSGSSNGTVERAKCQGPYMSRALAHAAASAVAEVFLADGFSDAGSSHPRWRLIAQREVRRIRKTRQDNQAPCQFNPRDVY